MYCYLGYRLLEYDFLQIARGQDEHQALSMPFQIHSSPGGGGGSLPLEFVPDARESPSEKHPKRGFNGGNPYRPRVQ